MDHLTTFLVHPADGSNNTFRLDDLSLLQLKDVFANFCSYPSLLELTSEDLVKGLQQLQMTKFRKKKLDFEVSISNRPFFRADQGSAIESPEKCLFWTPEGYTFWPPEGQKLQTAIYQPI